MFVAAGVQEAAHVGGMLDSQSIPIITAVISTVGALAGVLVGGLITTVVKLLELRQTDRNNERRLIVERLEELHRLIRERSSLIAEVSQDLIKASASKLDRFNRADVLRSISGSFQNSESEITQIAFIYCPDLIQSCTNLVNHQTAFLKFAGQVLESESMPLEIESLKELGKSHTEECLNFAEEVASRIRGQIRHASEKAYFTRSSKANEHKVLPR
jgi:hypothetical protein